MLEYALLASLIAVALIGVVGSVGNSSEEVFTEVGDAIAGQTLIIPTNPTF